MKLTVVKKCGISLSNHDTDKKFSAFSFEEKPPELFNCQSSDDGIVRKLVWSEILGDKPFALDIFLHHPWVSGPLRRKYSVQIQSNCEGDEDFVDILNVLRDTFEDSVKISVYVKQTSDYEEEHESKERHLGSSRAAGHYLIFEEGMSIRESRGLVECSGHSSLSDGSDLNLDMLFNVTVTVDISGDHERIRRAAETSIPLKTCKRMLDECLGSDVILIAGNGCEIRAHKSFLLTCSSVFRNMFASGLEESKSSRVDMTDLSENAVNAFLRFLYYGDKISPEDDMDLAFELLSAGHKYDVSPLENFMVSHLTERNDQEYGVKLAFKMYVFLRGMGTATDLKAKIVGILRRNIDELKLLPEYVDLFVKTPRHAMELNEEFAKDNRKRKMASTENDTKAKSKRM